MLFLYVSLKKNLRMAQHRQHNANECKLKEKAKELGKQQNGLPPSFLLSEKIPHGGERIFIFHVAVYLTAWPRHI